MKSFASLAAVRVAVVLLPYLARFSPLCYLSILDVLLLQSRLNVKTRFDHWPRN